MESRGEVIGVCTLKVWERLQLLCDGVDTCEMTLVLAHCTNSAQLHSPLPSPSATANISTATLVTSSGDGVAAMMPMALEALVRVEKKTMHSFNSMALLHVCARKSKHM